MSRNTGHKKDDFHELWSYLATIRGSAQLAKRATNTGLAAPQMISGYLTSVIEHVDLLSLRLAVMESQQRRDEGEDRIVDEAASRDPGAASGQTTPSEEQRRSPEFHRS